MWGGAEPQPADLDNDEDRENAVITLTFHYCEQFEETKNEIVRLIDGKNIIMSVKMA